MIKNPPSNYDRLVNSKIVNEFDRKSQIKNEFSYKIFKFKIE